MVNNNGAIGSFISRCLDDDIYPAVGCIFDEDVALWGKSGSSVIETMSFNQIISIFVAIRESRIGVVEVKRVDTFDEMF